MWCAFIHKLSVASSGDGPAPEEILTVVPGGIEDKIALKSGYDKYLGVNSTGFVSGCADAVGPRELWEPVFQVNLIC